KQGWIKHFKDGESETGFDHQVRARTASWRHGRLEGLVAVDIRCNETQYTLSAGEGNWWQSDTLVSKFRGPGKAGETSYLVRRVEYQISQDDVGKFVSQTANGNHIVIKVDSKLPRADNKPKEALRLGHPHVGKWLYVSVIAQTGEVTVTFHDKKK
ncbi:MAG: hypothetical protein ACXABY_18935, partial [Candidatus Thorarchaeota archaeon]